MRFNTSTFFWQVLYHTLGWPFGGMLCSWVEGYQASVNQQISVVPGEFNATGVFQWILGVLQNAVVFIPVGFYFAGKALDTAEVILLIFLWLSRVCLISIKYAVMDPRQLAAFHHETDARVASHQLARNLLGAWLSPSFDVTIQHVFHAGERASCKSALEWATRSQGLRMQVSFTGPQRVNSLQREHLKTVDNDYTTCTLTAHKFGKIIMSDDQPEGGRRPMQVPAGTLLSAIMDDIVHKGSESCPHTMSRYFPRVIVPLLMFLPLIVRCTVPVLPSAEVLERLASSAAVNSTAARGQDPSQMMRSTLAGDPDDTASQIAGFVMYFCGGLLNGTAMFSWLFIAVVDYRRRADSLKVLRGMLRPTIRKPETTVPRATGRQSHRRLSVTAVTRYYVQEPPLLDLRMDDNVFALLLMKDTLLFFGRQYLFRLNFLLSYAYIVTVVQTVQGLYSVFAASSLSEAARAFAIEHHHKAFALRHLTGTNVLAIVFVLLASIITLSALVFADFANDEPAYFRQALASQAIGMQSDLAALLKGEIEDSIAAEAEAAEAAAADDNDSAAGDEKAGLSRAGARSQRMDRNRWRRYKQHRMEVISQTIMHACPYIEATDYLYPIKILGMRADWGQVSGLVAVLASVIAAVWRASQA